MFVSLCIRFPDYMHFFIIVQVQAFKMIEILFRSIKQLQRVKSHSSDLLFFFVYCQRFVDWMLRFSCHKHKLRQRKKITICHFYSMLLKSNCYIMSFHHIYPNQMYMINPKTYKICAEHINGLKHSSQTAINFNSFMAFSVFHSAINFGQRAFKRQLVTYNTQNTHIFRAHEFLKKKLNKNRSYRKINRFLCYMKCGLLL